MIQARLERVKSDVMGTFGRLSTSLGWHAISIEMPWLDNARMVSCIPTGEYLVEWVESPKFRRPTYLVRDVPDRDGIRIHPGNLAGDITRGLISHFNGCIGLGMRLGVLARQRAVMTSAPAVLSFEDHMCRESFILTVA